MSGNISGKALKFETPATYRIRVKGHIEDRLSDQLGGMIITRAFTAEKQPLTILVGQLRDQAALSGVLNGIYEMHLPVLTDSLIGGEVARRTHERCPDDVLVLPVQWLGYSQHHIRYPGTVSAVSATHLDLMMDTVASMVDHGFKKILIQNSHGGNGANISVLLQRLMERDRLTAQEAEQRLAAQLDIEEKKRRADIVVDNSRDVQFTKHQLEQWLRQKGLS